MTRIQPTWHIFISADVKSKAPNFLRGFCQFNCNFPSFFQFINSKKNYSFVAVCFIENLSWRYVQSDLLISPQRTSHTRRLYPSRSLITVSPSLPSGLYDLCVSWNCYFTASEAKWASYEGKSIDHERWIIMRLRNAEAKTLIDLTNIRIPTFRAQIILMCTKIF